MANELTETEKNKKLLLMAGFTQVYPIIVGGDINKSVPLVWLYPDKRICYSTPDFLYSLDAQEKWLVPLFTYYRIEMHLGSDGKRRYKAVIHGDTCGESGFCETASDAFAEACLKLEGEGK